MPINFFLILATGFLTKFTDNLVDEPLVWHGFAKNLTGATYGLLAGFLASQSPEFTTMILAMTIGVLATGKIDDRAHQIGVAALVFSLIALGFPRVSVPFIALFAVMGVADEALNDWSDRQKEKAANSNRVVQWLASKRLGVELSALGVFIATANPLYFLFIFLFDAGYVIADKTMPIFVHSSDFFYTKQVLLQCVGCDRKSLDSIPTVRGMLDKLPGIMGVRKISEPSVFRHRANNDFDSGISGVVVIAESHIAIHTFPFRGFALVDVSSCRPIDSKKVRGYVSVKFRPKGVSEKIVEKGKGWPKSIQKAVQKTKEERMMVSRP